MSYERHWSRSSWHEKAGLVCKPVSGRLLRKDTARSQVPPIQDANFTDLVAERTDTGRWTGRGNGNRVGITLFGTIGAE